jgi:predicted amidophosphoribosyltransferase
MTYDTRICENCQKLLREQIQPEIISREDYEISVTTGGKYDAQLRNLILKWKDHGREDLSTIMRNIMSIITNHWHQNFTGARRVRIQVVPAPSSKQSVKKRGKWQTLTLAQSVAQTLRQLGYNAQVNPILKQRNAKKQVKFGTAERSSNKRSAIYCKSRWKSTRKRRLVNVIVVDDICTTGATINQCQRVLVNAGANVIGLFALASTKLTNS